MINFKQLAKEGKLGEVYITMHADRVIELFGKPDFTGGASNKHRWDNIWRYGDLELGFEHTNKLLFHFAVNFIGEEIEPEQGENLKFDSWVIKRGLTPAVFISECKKEGIEIRELNTPWNHDCIEYVTEGGMTVIFDADDKHGGLLKFVVSDHEYS